MFPPNPFREREITEEEFEELERQHESRRTIREAVRLAMEWLHRNETFH
jgi:hypothetical protein